jgi:recombinational DNA repair protein RecR
MTGGGPEIERLIDLMAKLPGLGPRSARRAALALVKKRERLLVPLAQAMAEVAEKVTTCRVCGNLAAAPDCAICLDPRRDPTKLCVVEDVADLWGSSTALRSLPVSEPCSTAWPMPSLVNSDAAAWIIVSHWLKTTSL